MKLLAVGAIALGSSSLLADIRATVEHISGSQRYTSVESYKGQKVRTVYKRFPSPGKDLFVVQDYLSKRVLTWTPENNEYTDWPQQESISAQTPGTSKDLRERVTISVRDTGEREVIFGRRARHLVLIEVHNLERMGLPVDGAVAEVRLDGWYLDARPPYPLQSDAIPRLFSMLGTAIPKLIVSGDTWSPGLATSETKTITTQGQSNKTSVEIKELSFDPVDDAEFAPPRGYRRVLRLTNDPEPSWEGRLWLYWDWLRGWAIGGGRS